MKTIHVVPHIHNESSGPSHSVPNLCSSLSNNGCNTTVACLKPGRDIEGVTNEIFENRSLYKSLGRSPDLFHFLNREVSEEETIIHNHSLWMFPNFYPGWIKKKNPNTKLVVAPRGTLSEYALSLSKWKKKLIWPLQKATLDYVDCFHATGEIEYKNIRKSGYKQPVAIIPNGVEIPDINETNNQTEYRTLLYLGRIHPKKGIDQLIKAWSELEPDLKDWKLDIVGPLDNAYAKRMLKLSDELGTQRICFKGEITGQEKNITYQKADLFVLPTHSENFGIVVAEALANATPVIVTDETPWEKVNEKQCGWCIPDDPEVLQKTLKEALASDNLEEMGGRGRKWMRENYSWDELGKKMSRVYKWLLNKSEKPEYVIVN